MNKLICRIGFFSAVLVMISTVFIFSGCASEKAEGVAIYLTRDDIPPAQITGVSGINLAESPIISMSDISFYNSQTFELTLSQSAYQRLYNLEVPVRGKSFVVCLHSKPVYWGAFWTPVSSLSFDGITIWKPFDMKEPYVVMLEPGYPSSSFYQGTDPRNNPEIVKTMEQAGKLITSLSINTIKHLPGSMKGYELYSWLDDEKWHYTLITGTNRNKTVEEIVSGEDFITAAGWVKIQAEDIDTLKVILSKVPEKQDIFWLAAPRTEQPQTGNIAFSLPPEGDVAVIREYAAECNLNLH